MEKNMPNYLRLTDKEGKSFEGRGLIEVDEALCKALGVEVNDKQFYRGWVDWDILYMKNDWSEVKSFYKRLDVDDEWRAGRLEVINWLAENYSLDGYYVF
jgi:hypothetical protein